MRENRRDATNDCIAKIRNSDPNPIRVLKYSKENIIKKVKEALKTPAVLYTEEFVNYRGNVDGEYYTEIVAQEILKMRKPPELCGIQSLRNIQTITRQKSYKTKSHNALANREKNENSKRDEEWIAIGMYEKTFDYIGEILDFQTPLKDVESDVAGKIDLLSYNKSENTAYILELKKPANKETLLRCVLEAYTYWEIADRKKLLCDFGIKDAELRKAVLVFKNSIAYSDFQDDKCVATCSLMRKLGVDLFVLDKDGRNVIEGYKH